MSDSLKEISEKQKDLKKKLKVSFVGEPGLGEKKHALKKYAQFLINTGCFGNVRLNSNYFIFSAVESIRLVLL